MRLLILGGNGMIGHRVWLSARDRIETWVTMRDEVARQPWIDLFDERRTIGGVSADEPRSLEQAMSVSRADVVFNAIGLVKQRPDASDAAAAFEANCFVPHYVRRLCDAAGARLIHLSTDCVFTGDRGGYSEADDPDAFDLYGLTKRLGEVAAPHLTIRTSAIGRSLSGTSSLLEWLLAQRDNVAGWRHAVFSGLATPELADTIVAVITEHEELQGLRHVAAPPIDKFTLLTRLRDAFGLPLEVRPADQPAIDRSLNDELFRAETAIPRPDWDGMIDRLASDEVPYERLRGEP